MGFLTVADIKRQLNMTGATDDSELSVYAAAASEIVEQWCGPMTLQTIIGELVYGTGSGFVLRNVPVITFTGITYSGPISSVASPLPTDFTFDGVSGIVSRIDGSRVDGPYRVSYTAGYAIPPPWAMLAAKMIAQHLWETRRGVSRRPTLEASTGFGYAIPNQATALMAPHRRVRMSI